MKFTAKLEIYGLRDNNLKKKKTQQNPTYFFGVQKPSCLTEILICFFLSSTQIEEKQWNETKGWKTGWRLQFTQILNSLSVLKIKFNNSIKFCIYWELFFTFDLITGDSANAVPHTKKLRTRVAHIWGNRRLQPNRSAMERPRPGETAFLITVLPVPGKYAWISDICPFE